jgi:hypothetical protein
VATASAGTRPETLKFGGDAGVRYVPTGCSTPLRAGERDDHHAASVGGRDVVLTRRDTVEGVGFLHNQALDERPVIAIAAGTDTPRPHGRSPVAAYHYARPSAR